LKENLKKFTCQCVSPRYLNIDKSWQEYEQEQGKHTRVYPLPTDIVRLDTTTASSHLKPSVGSIFQQGYSKDYRPDLAQVKIMLASLDPLGWTEASQVVAGNEADDPLYEPAIKQVRNILDKEGVLYVGDCKMGASSIRASIKKANDYYLMPLSATIVTEEVLDAYLTPVGSSSRIIEPIYRFHDNGGMEKIAQGFEINETVTGIVSGETISWSELCTVLNQTCRDTRKSFEQTS